MSTEQRKHLKLFRVGVNYPEQTHKLDPYCLGVWLGDGTSCCADITNPDNEILRYLKNYAVSLTDSYLIYQAKETDCPTIRFRNDNNKYNMSFIRMYLNEMNVLDNKHIPNEYLIDSRENRLKLLAGLIDTDGYASENCYEIGFMNEQLSKDVYRLCLELGFRTKMKVIHGHYPNMYKETNGYKDSWVISITGKLSQIPLLLERKKKKDSIKKSSLENLWSFTIEELPKNNYYGFVLDGDHRFLLADTTVSHNTWLLQKIALEGLKQRLNVVFVSMEMTREEVVQRFWKALWGAESGLVKEGTYEACRFVEDTSEEGKFRYELVDINVKDRTKSVNALQKRLRTNNSYLGHLRVIAYPAFGESVVGITNRIEDLAQEGFVADLLIIDYQDITQPIGGGSEVRNQLDLISKHLRGFSMKFHCTTVSASQTNRTGLNTSVVGGDSIAEDFRKLAHCTSMVSMEQTPTMRKNHLMRLRNIAMRNGESSDPCIFPQCLKLGQFVFGEPILAENLIMDNEEEEEDEC